MSQREKTIESAKRLARQGDYLGAIREYERLVEASPGDLEARLKIGYLHACNRDREAAAEVYLEVAHAYERSGDQGTAAKVLTQVLRLRPEQVDVYFWLADLLGLLGQPAEARRWLEAVERLLLERKRPSDALRALEAMVELDPGNVALLIRLGEGLVHTGQREEAVAALRQAADVLRMAEWVDDFLKVAERILYLDPSDTALGKEVAALHLRRRDPRAALRGLQRCYRAQKDDPETLGLLVETFLALVESRKAVTILEILAELHLGRGEAGAQEAAWKRILTIDPTWSPSGKGGGPVDIQAGSPPMELGREERGPEDSPVPLTTNERQLASLERSLQPDPSGRAAGRRFLPALTAQSEVRGRPVVEGTTELDLGDLEEVAGLEGAPREEGKKPAPPVPSGEAARPTRGRPAGKRGPPGRAAARTEPVPPRKGSGWGPGQGAGSPMTQELDLDDLEVQQGGAGPAEGEGDAEAELRALEAMIDDDTERRRPFRPVSTVPDTPVDRRRRDTQVSSPKRRPRR